MSDLHAREPDPDDGDVPVVELVEEDRVVGFVYLEDGEPYAEFSSDQDGEAWAFDVGDLQRVLDTARAMLDPEGALVLEAGSPETSDGEHPVDVLATEFDAAAVHRGSEDEGFYPVPMAARIVARCGELNLAVVSLEGFEVHRDWVDPVPGHAADLADAHDGEPWPVFKAGCNVQAEAVLEKWARKRERFAVAVEVADRDGERFVL